MTSKIPAESENGKMKLRRYNMPVLNRAQLRAIINESLFTG